MHRPPPTPLLPVSSSRRDLLALAAGGALGWPAWAEPSRELTWPRDHGAHLGSAIEWWYVTGWLQSPSQPQATPMGFQLTFFRRRVPNAQTLTSPLAAKHLVAAHAALSLPSASRQWHAQRIARWSATTEQGAVQLSSADLRIQLGAPDTSWQLRRQGEGAKQSLQLRVNDTAFALSLSARPTQALMLQGKQGVSQKGPTAAHQSWYLTWPHLALQGTVRVGQTQAASQRVVGRAWLDHEWSNGLMPPRAVGWDWVGLMWDDGHSLMAFQMRDGDGQAVWRAGAWRAKHQPQATQWPNEELRFEALRTWQSPTTGTRYPVAWRLHTPIGAWLVEAAFDAQELDGRSSTGIIYWEGLVSVRNTQGQRVGWGYLEMTGYGQQLRL